MKAEILHTRCFKDRFMRCISRYPVALQIAVPYIGKLPLYNSVVQLSNFLLHRGCSPFKIITRPPNSENGTISLKHADLIVNSGVELMIRKKLHSKIYQFTFSEGDRAAFVGSANFTMNGFERNDETVALFCGKEENDAVKTELERIAGIGAFEFSHWKIMRNIEDI